MVGNKRVIAIVTIYVYDDGSTEIVKADVRGKTKDTLFLLKPGYWKFGTLAIGKDSPIRPLITKDSFVRIVVNNKVYKAKTHKTIPGRIDGLSDLYAEQGFMPGDILKIDYDKYTKTLYLEKVGHESQFEGEFGYDWGY